MKISDFRSDTVTKPTKEMMEFMMEAPVGDDVFGEDPTVNSLEKKAAQLMGFEAALFCPSGTMTNQIALTVHLGPGTEVICHEESHIYQYECGGIARNAGASVKLIRGNKGKVNADDIEGAIRPNDIHMPRTRLIALEDTVNRGGGIVYDVKEIQKIRKIALEKEIPLHLDGARVFNALVATGEKPKGYARYFDSISICLSKGLGAPVGSVLLGSKDFIAESRRIRKVFGGGMRQAGIIAAAGIYALDHHIDRLKEDHTRAKYVAEILRKLNSIKDVWDPETNIVVAELNDQEDQNKVLEEFALNGIRLIPFGKGLLRAVTHININDDDLKRLNDAVKKMNL